MRKQKHINNNELGGDFFLRQALIKNTAMSKEELKKSVFMAVRWGVRLAPLLLMLAHWCLVVAFHRNPWEIVICADGNEACMIAMWLMTWVFPMAILWCAGYLFEFGWMWKIPFGYALGAAMVRITHWTLTMNSSTKLADYMLIVATLLVYWCVMVGKTERKA